MTAAGNVGQPKYMTNFDAKTLEILNKADTMRSEAQDHAAVAVKLMGEAGIKWSDGWGEVGKGSLHLVGTGYRLVAGAERGLEGIGNHIYGRSLQGMGVVAEAGREVRQGAIARMVDWVKSLVSSSNEVSARVGDGQSAAAIERDAMQLLGLTEALYAEAKEQFAQRDADFSASGAHFVMSFAHLVASGKSFGRAGGLLAGAAGDVLKATGERVDQLDANIRADWTEITGRLVQWSENINQLDADAQVELAKFIAGAADVIAVEMDGGVSVSKMHDPQAIDLSFAQLLDRNNSLRNLPGADQYIESRKAELLAAQNQ